MPVALLCWRIAEQLTAPHEAPRRRRLLESCVALLEHQQGGRRAQQMPMAAAAHEGLADGWSHEAHALLQLPALPTLPGGAAEPLSGEAAAAIGAQRAAARALLGVEALRVTRPGASPPRLLRLLAKLHRALVRLARRTSSPAAPAARSPSSSAPRRRRPPRRGAR